MNALPLRRHDVDWLRVFAGYLLFVFHTAPRWCSTRRPSTTSATPT